MHVQSLIRIAYVVVSPRHFVFNYKTRFRVLINCSICVLCVYVFTFEVYMNFSLCVFMYHVQSLENFVETVETWKRLIGGFATSPLFFRIVIIIN
jgi:hypothetical protein